MPLRTIVHGELWEKNVLLHRRSHFEMNGSNGSKRKVFDSKTSLSQLNANGGGSNNRGFYPQSRSFDMNSSRDKRDRDYRRDYERTATDASSGGRTSGGGDGAGGARHPRDRDLRNDHGSSYHRSSSRDNERRKSYGRDRYY